MKKKKEITAADRKVIEILLQENYTPKKIGVRLGFHKSTICGEISKRRTPNGYFADIAQVDRETKRGISGQNAKKIIHSRTRDFILSELKVGWSPEQIAGRMSFLGMKDKVCMETIYSFVYTDEYCKEDKIFQYLRRGRKKRKKQTGRSVHKSKIPNRISISKRPEVVTKRTELGHWEGDSVIYSNLKAINTVNELKTGFVVFTKLNRKTAKLTAQAMTKVFKGHYAKTLTLDNGTEFMEHEMIIRETKVETYFCHPYSSWERGSNENANGLLRGYLPKRTNIDKLTQEELDLIAEELNNRPRKRLGYRTPAEAYQQEIHNLIYCSDSF
jgi:transposase, IS30 family